MKKVEYYCDRCHVKSENNENLTYLIFSKSLSNLIISEDDLQIEVCDECMADIKEYINKNM